MVKNKYIGSSFEDFLEKDGLLEEVNLAAVKFIISNNLKQYMIEQKLTKTEMAKILQTSRSGLDRLLDPSNYSVTLLSLNRAAMIIGKKVDINLIPVSY